MSFGFGPVKAPRLTVSEKLFEPYCLLVKFTETLRGASQHELGGGKSVYFGPVFRKPLYFSRKMQ